MAFASVADVEALLRRDLTAQEEVWALRLLDMADAAITAEVPGVSFGAVVTGAVTTVRLVSCDDELWLPGRPVNAMTSVVIHGQTVDPGSYAVSKWGPLRASRVWPAWTDITVTWNYGFASAPGDVVNLAAGLVAQQLSDPNNVRSETIGQYSHTYATAGEPALSLADDQRRRLNRYRIKRTSIPIEPAAP